MASSATVTTQPKWLNANNRVHTFWTLRNSEHGAVRGPGVAGYEDFRVMAKQSGATTSVDIGKTGVGLMVAWLLGQSRSGQGTYEIDNIDRSAPTVATFASQLNVDISANASGQPRIDQVILEILDSQHDGGGSNLARIRVVAGTQTAGAPLTNRSGAATITGTSFILLADVVAASGFTQITATEINDRRPFTMACIPPVLTEVDMVAFRPPTHLRLSGIGNTEAGQGHNSHDLKQAAAMMYLDRRIVGATKMKWKYLQGGTASTGTYNIGIYDASGRLVVQTGSVALTGAAYSTQTRSETIATTTFEPGIYYVLAGWDTGTANGSVFFSGVVTDVRADASGFTIGAPQPNMVMYSATGGVTLPTTLAAMSDIWSAGSLTSAPGVPVVGLSVE